MEALFFAALDTKTEAERFAFLESACAGDAELRRQVEKLLDAHPKVGDFLTKPAVEQWVRALEKPGGDEDVGPDFLDPSTRPDSLGRLGHYEVLKVLGRGGFGIVFRAFDDVLHRVVAVKVLAPRMAATSPARKRFLREARASAQVRHENVVQVYAVEEKPLPYLVMEFIPGETLQQRLDRVGPLEVPEMLRIGRQIADGLAAAHATNLIHRDIKPANVLIETGTQDHVKITDFGLARAAADASLSGSGDVSGTPMYMSPEQAKGESLDHRADLFSLGSVLYVMATGRPPFRASNSLAILRRVAEDQPRPIRDLIPEVPEWLCGIVGKLHAKDPAARIQTARAVADLLADCEAKLKAHQEVKSILPAPAVKPAVPAGRSKWLAVAAVLLASLALAAMELAGVTHMYWDDPTTADLMKPGSEATTPRVSKQAPPRAVAPFDDDAVEHAIAFTDADVKRIAALPAALQVEEVRKGLTKRNPEFDGALTPTIANGDVTDLQFTSDHVKDISPVRALVRLRCLLMMGTQPGLGSLADLSPLKGMSLNCLNLMNNNVSDLAPLRGMKLERLMLWCWGGSDLTPLAGMPLKWLNCGGGSKRLDLTPLVGAPLESLCVNFAQVSDLAPLKDMPLTDLLCQNTLVSDLAPLRGLRLQRLHIGHSKVSDLAPVKGMPLNSLFIKGTSVIDLAPLEDLPLKESWCDFQAPRDARILRAIKTLETINDVPAERFLQE